MLTKITLFMRIKRNITTLIITLVVAFAGFSCSSNNESGKTATISGSIGSDSQDKVIAGTSATVVTAAHVTANGSMEAIEGAETTANASGEFELAVDAEAYQYIVVQAQSSGQTTMGYVSGSIENGSSYTIKPINAESSAETRVFARLVASGDADIVHKSDIEAVVTSENAAQINSSTTATANIASSLVTSARVRAEYIQEEFGSEADAKSEMIASAMIDAQTRLESSLNASTSAQARAEAYATFNQEVTDAYFNAELTATQTAQLVEMWGRVFMNSSASVASGISAEMNTQVSLYTAFVIDYAVRMEMEAANASEATMTASAQAYTDLKASVEASGGVKSELRAAFEAYHDDIRDAMESDSSFSAAVVVGIDSDINSSSGAKSAFDSSIATTLSASLVVDVYTTFYTAIETTVETWANSSTEVKAMTRLMILINAAS